MAERWIVNSSPLIHLAAIGRLGLFDRLGVKLLVPDEVRAEIAAGPAGDPARGLMESGEHDVLPRQPLPQVVADRDLGSGESAVIAAALNDPGATAILDDLQARRLATELGVRVRGTLGVIILARQRGLIASAAEAVRELRSARFHLDDELVAEVLSRTVGESWP